jgi:hypothetical protein
MSRTDGGVSLSASSAKTAARRLRRRVIALLSIYAALGIGFGLLHALHIIR